MEFKDGKMRYLILVTGMNMKSQETTPNFITLLQPE